MPSKAIPKLCQHKSLEKAYVTLNGKPRYLGDWPFRQKKAPKEVQKAYNQLIHRWLLNGRSLIRVIPSPTSEISISEICLPFLDFIEKQYSDPQRRQIIAYESAVNLLNETFGFERAEDPQALSGESRSRPLPLLSETIRREAKPRWKTVWKLLKGAFPKRSRNGKEG